MHADRTNRVALTLLGLLILLAGAAAMTASVRGFGAAPVLSDALRRIGRIAREQPLDRRERQLQLAHHHDKVRLVELGRAVVAIARRLIDTRRHQHPAFVVQAKCLQRKARPSRELPDADLFHAESLRAPPRAESSCGHQDGEPRRKVASTMSS